MPTAWSAPPLTDRLARLDGVLHERLALVDALRAGGARVRREAVAALHEQLAARVAP